jgi:TrmH family RNA methyltransferase
MPVVTAEDLTGLALPLFAAEANAKAAVTGIDLTEACGIVIGAEGRGVSPELAAKAIGVRIPTSGVESLNAAVAAGILLYEASRQRGLS